MKRSTRRRLTEGVLYAVLVVAVVALALAADWPSIKENFLDGQVAKEQFPEVITLAAKNTIVYTTISFLGGLSVALVLALMKLSPVVAYRWVATVYIEFFRGLPALLVIIFFGL